MEDHLRLLRAHEVAPRPHDPDVFWVTSSTAGYVLAKKIKETANGYLVSLMSQPDAAPLEVTQSECLPTQRSTYWAKDNMADLQDLNEGNMLQNVRERFAQGIIYTYAGLFCIAVNPYERIALYTPQIMQSYFRKPASASPPHLFALADTAYRSLRADRVSQSILCTGESGAGKTESTKKIIQYLAAAVAGVHGDAGLTALDERLLKANPVLEAFGNAATTKNDNSSRHGKYMTIAFGDGGSIVGANVQIYLLEKSRTVYQNAAERNFHSFYQLLAGAPVELKTTLGLQSAESYSYLGKQMPRALPDMNDAQEFQTTSAILVGLGFQQYEIENVWRVVAAVLQFGQVTSSASAVDDPARVNMDLAMQLLCSQLDVSMADLAGALQAPTLQALKSRGDATKADQTQLEVCIICRI